MFNPEKLDNHHYQYLEELQRDSLLIYYYEVQLSCLVSSAVNATVFSQSSKMKDVAVILYLI